MKVHPNRLKQITRRMMWLGGGLLLLMLVLSAINRHGASEVHDIRIEVLDNDKHQFVTDGHVKDVIFKQLGYAIEGRAADAISVHKVEKALESDPFIKNADVHLDMMNRLHISISQRDPMLRIIDTDGRSYYLDREGAYMPSSSGYAARVPVATGHTGVANAEYRSVKEHPANRLFQLMQAIEADDFMKAQVEQIYVEPDNDFVIVPKVGSFLVEIGTLDDLDLKFRRLKIFFKEGIPRVGWTKYRKISVKYRNQVVATRT